MNIAKLAVSRPVTVLMVVLTAIFLGFVSLSRLSVDLLPEMNFPIAAVVTTYEGAGPQEVESLITRPIEEAMTSLGDVTGISSISSRGQSLVLVEFDWGTDMDFAALDMRERVDQVKEFLPDGAGTPRILRFDPSSTPIIQLGMGGGRDVSELKQIAEDVVKSRIERIDGVASLLISGGRDRQVHVHLDPTLMRAYGVPFEYVIQALQAANLNLPGGQIDTGRQEVTVRTTGEFQSLEDIAQVRVPTATGTVLLREIATVSMGESDVTQISRLNRQPSIMLQVVKESGANTVQVARAVRAELDRIEQEIGDLEFAIVYDESAFIEQSINSVSNNAIVGGLLAAAVLYAFLRSFSSTLVIAIAIPISIVFTFLLIYFNGMTLNMLSLGGLALGVGMLVDNSIVVLENIYRHRVMGKDAVTASIEGTQEVGAAVFASTLTTVAVFIPVIFIEGFAAQIFTDLSLTVSFSLISSLGVAMTLVPLLASRLLAGRLPAVAIAAAAAEVAAEGAAGPRGVQARGLLGRVLVLYERLIRGALKRRWLTLAGVFLVLVATMLFMWPRIGSEFLPSFDEGQLQVTIQMPRGVRLAETLDAVSYLEELVLAIPEVQAILSSVGNEDASDEGSILVQLVPLAQRSRSTAQVIEEIRSLASALPTAKVQVRPVSTFDMGAAGAPVQVQLRGDDRDLLAYHAQRLADVIRTIPGTREVRTSLDESRPELQVRVDRERAGQLGLSVVQVATAVRAAVGGQTATIYRAGGQEIDIVVRLAEGFRQNLDDVRIIPIGTPFGIVPLSEVAQLVEAQSPLAIDRTDQTRVVAVNAQLADRDLGSVMEDVRAAVEQMDLPAEIEVFYGGQDELMEDAFADLGLAFVLSIVLVFAVLASQFESIAQPLVIVFSIPFAIIGAVWGLYFTGHNMSVVGFIGAIILVGIVVNNAILLVDFINQARRAGVPRLEAVVQSGKVRLRPILMTTLTTVLGMLPLALGIGEGSELEAPLAIVVSAGLSSSTFLTLVLVPTIYVIVDDFSEWIRRTTAGMVRKVRKES